MVREQNKRLNGKWIFCLCLFDDIPQYFSTWFKTQYFSPLISYNSEEICCAESRTDVIGHRLLFSLQMVNVILCIRSSNDVMVGTAHPTGLLCVTTVRNMSHIQFVLDGIA